jgi:hypothetical protein
VNLREMSAARLVKHLLVGSIPENIRCRWPRPTGGTFPEDFKVNKDGYPDDSTLEEIAMVAVDDSERWLRDVFPSAVMAIPYAKVDVEDVGDERRINFWTGGWSGCESVIGAILDNPVMRLYLMTESRGGRYVFVVKSI